MNTGMFENPVTQDNLETLRRYGWEVIAPASGRLACGDVGAGKLPEPEQLLQHILRLLALPHDLAGKRVLVTAGPTQESIDPVRYLNEPLHRQDGLCHRPDGHAPGGPRSPWCPAPLPSHRPPL